MPIIDGLNGPFDKSAPGWFGGNTVTKVHKHYDIANGALETFRDYQESTHPQDLVKAAISALTFFSNSLALSDSTVAYAPERLRCHRCHNSRRLI